MAGHRGRRAAHRDRLVDQRDVAAEGRRGDLLGHAEVHLRVFEDLVDGVNRPTWHAGGVERVDPFATALLLQNFLMMAFKVSRLRDPSAPDL